LTNLLISKEQNLTIRHESRIVNGIRLHYVEAGDGPLVLLLHGFPGFWRSWRHQIPALAAAGFHVVAPDMRGYNLSEKPPGVAAYRIDHLVKDVVELLRTFGGEAGGFLIGHDWGGLVAWHTASRHPELVKKLVILNAPHPNRYLEVLRTSRSQQVKSLYVAFFQIPWLPERLLTARHGALVERSLRNAGINVENFTPEDMHSYRQAITRPGAASSALNYYRAMARRMLRQRMKEDSILVQVPTLLLWGRNDVALEVANADHNTLLRWVPNLKVEFLDASHWVQFDQPTAANERIIAFLIDDERQHQSQDDH
jgi:pimeloyl-ACP methyl ester carboxylesterase